MRFTPFCLAVVAIATGCSTAPGSVAEPAATATTGALTVDWTIAGTTDPNQCVSTGAAAIEITLLDTTNRVLGSFQQSCSAFRTSITLDAGLYSTSARLLDAAGVARTRPVRIDYVTIYANSELFAPVDFTASTFF